MNFSKIEKVSVDLYNELIKYVQEKERVCPLPHYWSELFNMFGEKPANPLILGGWYSSNYEKRKRLLLHIKIALDQGIIKKFDSYIRALKEKNWHYEYDWVPTDTDPFFPPHRYNDYREIYWNDEPRAMPSDHQLKESLSELITNWQRIVGKKLSTNTYPLKFLGKKYRRLIVVYKNESSPPWGTWTKLSSDKTKRSTFTKFRSSINNAIKPHEVDHIDFVENKND